MVRADFDRTLPPHWWTLPRRAPKEPPEGYAWRKALEPGPINGPLYVPQHNEIVFVSPWAGRDSYATYEIPNQRRIGNIALRGTQGSPYQRPPPVLFLVNTCRPSPGSPFAWLEGLMCMPAIRVPYGNRKRIWVRMTEVTSVADAEMRGLILPLTIGEAAETASLPTQVLRDSVRG